MSESKMSASYEGVCVICKLSLSGERTTEVHQRGLQRFIDVSKIHEDELYKRWETQQSDIFHERCRLKYLHSRDPSDPTKGAKKQKTCLDQDATSSSTVDISDFDYENHCLICNKKCTTESEARKAVSKRQAIHRVTGKSDIAMRLREAAENVFDDLSAAVKLRVAENVNLVERKAVYHSKCYTNFLLRKPKKYSFAGAPHNQGYAQNFALVCKQLRNNPDKQHIFDNLYDLMGENRSRKDYFTRMIKNFFGDDIIVSSLGPLKTVITFRKKCDQLLLEYFNSRIEENRDAQRLQTIVSAATIIREDIKSTDYNTDVYPVGSEYFKEATNHVPNSLQVFLDILTTDPHVNLRRSKISSCITEDVNEQVNQEDIPSVQGEDNLNEEETQDMNEKTKTTVKLTSIAHAIVNSVNHHFISPILLSLSKMNQ